jgi:uncharacterized membrane protein
MARVDRRAPLALWLGAGAFAAGFGALSMLRQRSFETGRFDLGNMVQAVWFTAHGHPLRVTNLRGEQALRLGAHLDPVLVLFAPLWWIWPSPDLLLVTQSIALALGALPVYWLGRKHLRSRRAGLGFALAYLVYPATTWLALNEFHPGALATPALLFAFWYLDEDRLVPFALFALFAAICREDMPLVLAGYGVWYALARGRRREGTLIAVASLFWVFAAAVLVIPQFRGGQTPFVGRYSEARAAALHHPWTLFNLAFDHIGIRYLLTLLLPLAALSLFAPIALAALPPLVLNLLSAVPAQSSIHFHYTAPVIAPLVAAAVLGGARVRAWTGAPVASIALVAAVVGNYLLGAIPLWSELPHGESLQSRAAVVTAHDRVAARALALIPPHAAVSATNSLGAHLSARSRVLSFPYIQDAKWVAVDETRPGYADRLAPLPTAAQVVWLRNNPAWRLVFERDGVLVFHRVLPP